MTKKTIFRLAAAAIIGFAATACSEKDEPKFDDEGTKVELPSHRMFVLNQGIWGQNNASLAFIDPANPTNSVADIYLLQNGMLLGDTGQSMIRYNNDIYVVTHTSNHLLKLNSAGVESKFLSFVNDSDLRGGIRYIAADNGYVYATFYGGYLLKINASTLAIEQKVKTPASNLEGIAVYNGRIYVSDAYEITYNDALGYNEYIYHDRLLVYSTADLSKVAATVTVGQNPNKIFNKDGKLFVLCLGNYYDKGYEAYLVDGDKNNAITLVGGATEGCIAGDKAYFVNSITDWTTYITTNNFFSYDIAKGTVISDTPLRNAPAELYTSNISLICADPYDGDIYVGVTYYASSNGDLYRFDSDGNFKEKLESLGQHPVAAVFFK